MEAVLVSASSSGSRPMGIRETGLGKEKTFSVCLFILVRVEPYDDVICSEIKVDI